MLTSAKLQIEMLNSSNVAKVVYDRYVDVHVCNHVGTVHVEEEYDEKIVLECYTEMLLMYSVMTYRGSL